MKFTLKSMWVAFGALLVTLFEPLHKALFHYMARSGLVLTVTEAVKSAPITNADATPAVLNKAQVAGARARHFRGVCAAAATMAAGSTYRFFRVKSSDMLHQLLLDNATLGAG